MDEQSNLKETLAAIDKVIADKKAAIKRGEALERLKKNQDFIDVILSGYVKAEEIKLFNILTDPSGASPYSDAEITLKLSAISHFKGYIGTDDFPGTVKMEADSAPLDIDLEEQYRRSVTAEFSASKG
jgi:hypothetical protein